EETHDDPVVSDVAGHRRGQERRRPAVGRAVVDLLAEALGDQPPCALWPITITGGHAVTASAAGGTHVPKRELVGTLQVLLQCRRLRVARGLPEAALLARELETFGLAVTASRAGGFRGAGGRSTRFPVAGALGAGRAH